MLELRLRLILSQLALLLLLLNHASEGRPRSNFAWRLMLKLLELCKSRERCIVMDEHLGGSSVSLILLLRTMIEESQFIVRLRSLLWTFNHHLPLILYFFYYFFLLFLHFCHSLSALVNSTPAHALLSNLLLQRLDQRFGENFHLLIASPRA